MNHLKPTLIFCFLCSYVLSLFFYETAKAWLSVSMFGLLACALVLNNPLTVIKTFFREKQLWVMSLAAVSLFVFMLNSENMLYAWNRIEVKAPLLGLTLALAGMGKMERSRFHQLLALFVLMCVLTGLYTLLNYTIHYNEVTESYLRAKVMPTLINHVRYSVMVAMGAYASFYLFKNKYQFGIAGSRVFLVMAVLLFLFLHVYSVRSGLVAIYGIAFTELLLYVKETRKYKLAIGGFVLLFGLMVLAIKTIPTLQNKWVNTVNDMNTYLEKGYPNYNSLTTRFISYEAAWAIFKENPVMGCGIGDIKDASDAYFKQYYPAVDIPILPHNQFLFSLAATGMLGLIVFCVTFYFPLFYQKGWRNNILLMHYITITLSFMTEPMLETQLGMAFVMFFIVLPLGTKDDMINE